MNQLRRIKTISEFFHNARGYENGINRKKVAEELLPKIYDDTSCSKCAFGELQQDLNLLRRKFDVRIYCPKASLKQSKWSEKRQRNVSTIIRRERRYYHLNDISEFDLVINKLTSMLQGIENSKNGLESEKEAIATEQMRKTKQEELRKVMTR
jgi:uncharacterized protein (DUF2225 family)